MKKPYAPRKPCKPTKPNKTIENSIDILKLDNYESYNLQYIIDQANVLGCTDLSKLAIYLDYYGEDNDSKVYTTEEIPNPHYDTQLKNYNRKLKQYNKKLKEYNKKRIEWVKLNREYLADKANKDKIVRKQQYEDLKKEFEG